MRRALQSVVWRGSEKKIKYAFSNERHETFIQTLLRPIHLLYQNKLAYR